MTGSLLPTTAGSGNDTEAVLSDTEPAGVERLTAAGAVRAARFIVCVSGPGLYNMSDVLAK